MKIYKNTLSRLKIRNTNKWQHQTYFPGSPCSEKKYQKPILLQGGDLFKEKRGKNNRERVILS